MISWKYTFKRLNEEYEIAKKKKQALDNLFVTGRISQATRDSFTGDIGSAIIEIEKQRQDLAEKMQAKTQELDGQLKTLETLLANYEIQHVVGEIDEEIYTRGISLLANSLETTRNELGVIKLAIDQLFPTAQPIQAPAAPEPVAPVIEAEVAQPAPVEAVPLEVPVEAAPIEPIIVETVPVEPAIVETAPFEAPIETMQAEAAPVECAPIETPVEAAPAEAAPVEVAPAPIENIPFENAPVETAPVEATPTIEAAPVEAAPVEAIPIITPEPELQIINEPTPESVIAEPAVQEPIINILSLKGLKLPLAKARLHDLQALFIEKKAPVEQPTIEAPAENATPTEVIAEAASEQPAVEVPLQAFEVTEQEPIETTLERVMEPVIEAITEPIKVEEAHVPAHPLEAPRQAPSEVITETDSDQTPPVEESEENTTE